MLVSFGSRAQPRLAGPQVIQRLAGTMAKQMRKLSAKEKADKARRLYLP